MMSAERLLVVAPDRPVLAPILWVLRSGWLPQDAQAVTVPGDAESVAALAADPTGVALVDPACWARQRQALRPVLRTAVSLGPHGTDLLLLSRVRLDGLEAVTAPASLERTSDGAVVRALAREFYGVPQPVAFSVTYAHTGEPAGRIAYVTATEATGSYPHVESIARAWWLLTGGPWVRAMAVQAGEAPQSALAEAVFRETARVLKQEHESVARGVAGEHGGSEERWLDIIRGLSLGYGADERKGLSALLARASRAGLCPKLEDAQLPRY